MQYGMIRAHISATILAATAQALLTYIRICSTLSQCGSKWIVCSFHKHQTIEGEIAYLIVWLSSILISVSFLRFIASYDRTDLIDRCRVTGLNLLAKLLLTLTRRYGRPTDDGILSVPLPVLIIGIRILLLRQLMVEFNRLT